MEKELIFVQDLPEEEQNMINDSLYCNECGEDDISKLAYEANYGGFERMKIERELV